MVVRQWWFVRPFRQWWFDVGCDGAEETATVIAGVGLQVLGSSTDEWLLTDAGLPATPEPPSAWPMRRSTVT